MPLLPRILTGQAPSKTGIDTHPAAKIADFFCIDHGTGLVIGETTKIGKHVKRYQGVKVGALSVRNELAFTRRHPTVEDPVVIYAAAKNLGGETVIVHPGVIGSDVWLTETVSPGSLVYHTPEVTIFEGKYLNAKS